MALQMIVNPAQQLGPHVWQARLSPYEVQRLGPTKNTAGAMSVLLVQNPAFDSRTGEFRFDASEVTILNIGTTPVTILIGSGSEVASVSSKAAAPSVRKHAAEECGPGDREFLREVERSLEGQAKDAARLILQRVRATEPGDLQRGQRLNFKNKPDNFWYVIIQPRVQSLSITVRGAPERFQPSKLDPKMDRPGYTRFSLRRPDEVDEAIRIIQASKRRPGTY